MTLVLAHRGAPFAAPENTMPSFEIGARTGVDAIELDVHLSADGRLVVIHDPTLDRTTDRTGAVAALSLDAIRAADAGHAHTVDGGASFPFRGRGLRVPTLVEVLDWLPVNLGIVVEVKAVEATEPTVDLLRRRGVAGRASVISFVLEAIERSRAAAPEIPTGLLLEPGDDFDEGLARATAGGHATLNLDDTALGTDPRPLVERAGSAGVRVGSYVVDEQERMRVLAAAGVGAFVTNRPDVAAAAGFGR
ncbi:MAG: glycerophosphodiester phosphodiesterase [Candidatus Limnocylindria bacterium]